jgi:Ca2+-binding EF-hand superfamily protein
MLTKMKVALVLCGSLVCGVAAAQSAGSGSADRTAEHAQRKAQFEAKKQEMLKKFDTNNNGTLDDAERAAMQEARMVEHFKKLDTDGNGSISLAEFKAGKKDHMGKGGRHARGGRGRFHRGGPRDQGTK